MSVYVDILYDVFLMPSSVFAREQRQYLHDLASNFGARVRFDNGAFSEPLMYLACYQASLSYVCVCVCVRVCVCVCIYIYIYIDIDIKI